MRYFASAPLIAALAITALPATAQADRSDCSTGLEKSYSKHYIQVAHRHGKRAPGRNIRKQGIRYRFREQGKVAHAVRNVTCNEMRRSNVQLKRLLSAPAVMFSRAVPPGQRPAGVQTDFNVAALPDCTWRPESGGNYNAVNPSSGAYGKYQVIPSTWAAHCSDLDRGPAGQEQCAVRIYKAQGPGAWVGC